MSTDCIAWTVRSTRLGLLLVAGSPRGVCHVRFGDDEPELAAALAAEFPYAVTRRDDAAVASHADTLAAYVEGRSAELAVPLDVRGSAFQRRVWDALRSIPRGQTRSYADVAAAIGRPGAARAVARACAGNPLALAVPCHRVVPASGGTGGYRYGSGRKSALLEAELADAPPESKVRPRRRRPAA
jgi:AraC family transcriptional regulator of adaptative response/methylated-DNA-[protein]-cysteine methyltransferase